MQQELAKAIEASSCDNVAGTLFHLLSGEDESSDAALERAVEEKYESLRDHLLVEALVRQLGAAEWARLSEEQRQRHLAAMRLKERQLRREGRLEELALLLGEASESGARLAALLGDEKAAQEARWRERLARRKRRLEEGMEEAEAEKLMKEEEEKEEAEAAKKKNVLLDLDRSCEKVRIL